MKEEDVAVVLSVQDEHALLDIIAKDAIRDLIYSYCHSIDRCDYDKMRALYWEDGRDEHGVNPSCEVEDFIAMIKGYYVNATSIQHHVTNLYIKVDGDYAEAEGYVVNSNLLPGTKIYSAAAMWTSSSGEAGEWKFLHRRLSAEWIESGESGPDNRATDPTTHNMYRAMPGETDPSYAFFRLFRRGER